MRISAQKTCRKHAENTQKTRRKHAKNTQKTRKKHVKKAATRRKYTKNCRHRICGGNSHYIIKINSFRHEAQNMLVRGCKQGKEQELFLQSECGRS